MVVQGGEGWGGFKSKRKWGGNSFLFEIRCEIYWPRKTSSSSRSKQEQQQQQQEQEQEQQQSFLPKS